ncbi:MAG: hypothetical protein IPF68_07835 [Bacteroidales bacterium]|nr:hypothetical protein [Bacteroidales bacterium]
MERVGEGARKSELNDFSGALDVGGLELGVRSSEVKLCTRVNHLLFRAYDVTYCAYVVNKLRERMGEGAKDSDGAKDSGRARKSELNDFSGALGVGGLKLGVRS